MTGNDTPAPQGSGQPRLDLGSSDNLLAFVESLNNERGVQAVVEWAEKELRPGRQISYGGQNEGLKFGVIHDRSLWRLDLSGGGTKEALLPPLTDEKFDESELFGVWAWPLAPEPFLLRIRTRDETD